MYDGINEGKGGMEDESKCRACTGIQRAVCDHLYGILAAVLQLAVAFVLWAYFMRYYRAQAKKMNEMIQKMNR